MRAFSKRMHAEVSNMMLKKITYTFRLASAAALLAGAVAIAQMPG